MKALRYRRCPETLGRVVRLATARKAALLDPDPYEVDLRRVLNLGHSFGHALETQLAYTGLRHGEAVGFGLALSTLIARRRGLLSGEHCERILAVLHAYGLPPQVAWEEAVACGAHLDHIRLVRGRRLNFVMPTGLDSVTIAADLEPGEAMAALEGLAAHPVLSGCLGAA